MELSPLIMATMLSLLFLTMSVMQAEGQLCKTPGCECKNGGIYWEPTKTCNCTAGFSGFDCGIATGRLCPTSDMCQNGGLCHGGTKCYCHGDYFGPYCEYERVTLVCSRKSIKMSMYVEKNPNNDYEIYAFPTPRCSFKKSPTGTVHEMELYELEVNLTSTRTPECMDVVAIESMNNQTTYSVHAMVRHFKNVESPADWSTTYQCKPDNFGETTHRDVTRDTSDIFLLFLTPNGEILNETKRREPFDIVFLLRPNTFYKGISLEKLDVHDQKTEFKLFSVISGGRLSPSALRYVSQDVANQMRPVQERISYVIDGQNVTALKVHITGLHSENPIYLEYRIYVCKTVQCPTQEQMFPGPSFGFRPML